jgi:hypothetical protein
MERAKSRKNLRNYRDVSRKFPCTRLLSLGCKPPSRFVEIEISFHSMVEVT